MNKKDLQTSNKDRAIKDIVWMARRYCEGRQTGAPGMFNDAYDVLKETIDFDEENDPDNRKDGPISNFPYATSGYEVERLKMTREKYPINPRPNLNTPIANVRTGISRD